MTVACLLVRKFLMPQLYLRPIARRLQLPPDLRCSRIGLPLHLSPGVFEEVWSLDSGERARCFSAEETILPANFQIDQDRLVIAHPAANRIRGRQCCPHSLNGN